jgi:hypothetical protein
MGETMKVRKTAILSVLTTLALLCQVAPAVASDSVRVPGQIPVEQCPVGFQYNTGIEVNVSTHEEFTICNAPPTEAELLLRQQDADFRAAQDAAIASATRESQAWNAANPGMQKCVQWGPVVHANGVSTSSGGVCANPVGANDANSLPSAPAEPVTATDPVNSIQSIDASDGPFTREVEGQVGLDGCPTGYQGANGLTVDTSNGHVTTQCWAPAAWQAWVLGGSVWEQFKASGGTYDVAAELDRRAKLVALKNKAKSVAQAAADLTPGVRRCSAWSGYGETGSECAYAFIAPTQGANSYDSKDTVTPPTLGSSIDAADNVRIITVAAAAITTATSYTFVNSAKRTKVVTKSLTPKVCSVANLKVKAKAKGTCVISYKTTTAAGKVTTVKKTIVFTKSS